MELAERLEWFMKMLHCKYPVDLQVYDRSLTPHEDLSDDHTRMLHKILASSDALTQLQKCADEGHDLIMLGGSLGLLWGVVCQRENGIPKSYYILGPVSGAEIDLRDLENELHTLLNSYSRDDKEYPTHSISFEMRLSELLRSFATISNGRFLDDLVMFGCCVTGQSYSRSDVEMNTLSHPSAAGKPDSQSKRKNDRHRTWMLEQALMNMVREGNLDYQKALNQSARVSDGVPVRVRGSLQQAQISVITLITLCVRAAISGGLTPDVAYTVGDSYVQQVMDCTSIPEMAQVSNTMFDDFVHRVHNVRRSPDISPKIQQCMDYLELHTEEEVGIRQLAEMVGYTEYYLSRKFKEEAHCSVNDYSKIARIERAKILLYTTDDTTAQIADRLHFCSASYFAKEFRKFTGQTPAEYRESNTQ